MKNNESGFAMEELYRISDKYNKPIQIGLLEKVESAEEKNKDIFFTSSTFFNQQFNQNIQLQEDGFAIQWIGDCAYLIGNTKRSFLYATYTYCEKQYGYKGSRLKESFPLKEPDEWPKCYIKNPLFERRSLVIEEIDDVSFLMDLIAWSARNGINELFFTFQLWDKVEDRILPELEKREIKVCLGGHSLEFLLGEEKDNLNELVFENKKAYLNIIVSKINHYLKKTDLITKISLWPKDKGIDKEKSDTFINDYICFNKEISKKINPKIEFIAYNAGLSWSMLEGKNNFPEGLDLLFAYWGRDYSQSLKEPDKNQQKAIHFLEDWIFHAQKNRITIFEYYSDFFMQTELFAPLAKRIVQDTKFYYEKKITGMSNLIVPVKKSLLTEDPEKETFYKQVVQFNNYAFAKAMWGSSDKEIYESFFDTEDKQFPLYVSILQELEENLSTISSYNFPNFPLRIVDDVQPVDKKELLSQLLKIRNLLQNMVLKNLSDDYMKNYLNVLLDKLNQYLSLLEESKR